MDSMREVLRGSLGRSLRRWSEEDRLAAAWTVVCGAAMARHGELLEVDAGRRLHVRVRDPAWRQTFFEQRTTLAAELSRIAKVPLTGLHFEGERGEGERGRALPSAAFARITTPPRSARTGRQENE